MKTVKSWIEWYFLPHGIVWAEEAGKLSWFQTFVRLLSGAVKRSPDGPTSAELALWQRIRRPLKRYKCSVCGTYVWSWKKVRVCYKFSCYRERNESVLREHRNVRVVDGGRKK